MYALIAALAAVALLPLVLWVARIRSVAWAVGFALGSLAAVLALAIAARPRGVPESEVTHRPIQELAEGDVSSDACRACHPREHATWDLSYHSSMTQVATPETVRAPWNWRLAATISENGVARTFNYTLVREGDEFWVHSPDDPDFSAGLDQPPGRRQVVLITGSHHQQFYWYATGEDRLLAQLPVAYSLREERWLPVNTMLMIPPTKPAALLGGWSLVCMRCHTTHSRPRAVRREGARQGAAVTHETFESIDARVSEFGIACESCHGGAAEHARRQRNPLQRYASHFTEAPDDTIVNPAELDSKRSTDVCGVCHSNHVFGQGTLEDLADFNEVGFRFRPGDVLSDTLRVMRWSDRDDEAVKEVIGRSNAWFAGRFWNDGMPNSSGREYNGLIESACFRHSELSCLSCHQLHRASDDPRTPLDWADDQLAVGMRSNEACVGCHPSHAEGPTQHTRHAEGSSGSLCYNCHMPHTAYALLKQSRSHEIDSPSVQTTLATGRPDACSLCHLDRPLVETAATLEEWYGIEAPEIGDLEHRFTGYGVLQALRGDASIRAMMAWHMGWGPAIEASGSEWMAPLLASLLEDPYPPVRYLAGEALGAQRGFEDFEYDHMGSVGSLAEARDRALERWERAVPAEDRSPRESVLLDSRGRLNTDRLVRYQSQRDDRPVYRVE